jgi:uncharacterized membrane-anchored protein YitT (DUF2179 family)
MNYISKILKILLLPDNNQGFPIYNKNDKHKFRKSIYYFFKDLLLISFGILSAGFGLKSFLLPSSFIDGGVTGISLLTSITTKFPLPILILIINVPFVILGFTQFSKRFAVKSIISISGLALCLAIVDYPIITHDKLLVAIFGGIFLGAGIGLCIRGSAVLDGTEIFALFLSKKTGFTIGDIIWIINILIFIIAAYLLSIESALYSILTYFSASKIVDFIIEGFEEYTGVTIVSDFKEEIRIMIIEKLGRGVTIYNGQRGYAKYGEELKPTEIIYTVITRLEIAKLKQEVQNIDPGAFIIMNSIKDTKGGTIKKRTIKDK